MEALRLHLMGVSDLDPFQLVSVSDCGNSSIVFHCRIALRGAGVNPSFLRDHAGQDAAAVETADVAVKVLFVFDSVGQFGDEKASHRRRAVMALVQDEVAALTAMPFHENVTSLLRVLGPCRLPPHFYRLLPEDLASLQSSRARTMALVTPFHPYTLGDILKPVRCRRRVVVSLSLSSW